MEYLVIDMARVLDESRVGQQAAQGLQAQFDAAKVRYDKLVADNDDAAAEAFEAQSIEALEGGRTKARKDLLDRAQPLIQSAAKARGVGLVLEADAVVWVDPKCDITERVIAGIDAG
jgi:Skp family chaperone for outer membrane proteins